MNVKINKNNVLLTVICSSLLLSLPGCKLIDWFKGEKKEEVAKPAGAAPKSEEKPLTGEILVSIDGKPLVSADSLRHEKDKLLKSNPQLKAMMAFMDSKQFDRNLSEGLLNQAIVDRFIADRAINKQAEYLLEMEEGYKAIERMLNAKYFSQEFPVTVSIDEVKSFYEKNKEAMPNLLLSRGGIGAMGIQFDDQAKAQLFLEAAKLANNDINKAAQAQGLSDKVKDFKLVHSQSIGIDAPLKDKIVGMKQVPSTELFVVEGKFWVVSATTREEAKYRPFDQVKNEITAYLEKEKRAERFDEEIDKLKEKYHVIINEDYFKVEEMAAPEEMPAAVEVKANKTPQNQQPKGLA